MSRSYKHTPRCGDRKSAKTIASRKFRRHRTDYLLQRSLYKRTFPQWDICDYETVGYTWEQFLEDYYHPRYLFLKEEKSEKELYREYKKYYINK